MTQEQQQPRAVKSNRCCAGSPFASAAFARVTSPGKKEKHQQEEPLTLQWIDALAESARFWRTLVVVKRKVNHQPSSLERGSAATRTVVRSISLLFGANELTHISRINRR